MLLLRKIIFYIFALIYLILCPLIVARMLGFVISSRNFQLVKTGLVYVDTNPPDATVYIDGHLERQKTPLVIRDLIPGDHFIRVESSGYQDWERNIPIVGKEATVLANILLIPEEWPIKTISSKAYQNIFFADDDILIATNSVLKDIDIFHTTLGLQENFNQDITFETIPLFSPNSIYAQGRLVRLFHAPQNPFILLQANINDKPKFLWVNLRENPPLIEDISDLFPEIPSRVSLDNSNDENIYAVYPQHIYRISIKDKAIYSQEAVHLKPFASNLPQRFLINDKNDLLLHEGRWIRLFPEEDFGTAQTYNIARANPSTDMYFEERNGKLFFLDETSGHLCAAQILPYHPMLNIPIPDALRFKKDANKS